MADKKISALTGASTPLAGTEVLPVVQSGSTVKVAVSNLTAGRAVSGLSFSAATNIGLQNTSDTAYSGIALNSNDANAATRNWAVVSTYNDYGDLCFVQSAAKGGDPIGGNVRAEFSAGGVNFKVNSGNFVVGTAGKGITTGGATALGLGVNNAVDAMTIDTSKNVGVGTTTPTSGSMSNSAIVNAGVFSTLRGSVASTSGVATTIATANQNHALATYIVSCGVSSGAPTAYSAVAIVSADNNTLRITNLQTATNMTISVSGTDIQATQTSGGAANILFAVTRVA